MNYLISGFSLICYLAAGHYGPLPSAIKSGATSPARLAAYTWGVAGLIFALSLWRQLTPREKRQDAGLVLLNLSVIGGLATGGFYLLDAIIRNNHKQKRKYGQVKISRP